jgi:hypothetical protein
LKYIWFVKIVDIEMDFLLFRFETIKEEIIIMSREGDDQD